MHPNRMNRFGSTAMLEIRLWARRTTVEGLPNLLAARSTRSRVFWAALLVAVTTIGLTHLVLSIRNYQASGVSSEVTIDGAAAEFPSLSLCSQKSVSESLLKYYGPVVHRHLDVNWGYFDNWFELQRRQGDGENVFEYRRRVQLIFNQMMQLLWVSDDTRDLGLVDRTTILDCSFNGVTCNHHNFSLLQHYTLWNCYTFRPHEDLRFVNTAGEYGAGLTINIFSDNNFFESSYRSSARYDRRDYPQDYHTKGLTLRQVLNGTVDDFPMNMALDDNYGSAGDGILLSLDGSDSFPKFRHAAFLVQNGMSATHHVFTVEQNKLNRPGSPCNESDPDRIRYVVGFGSRPDDLIWREFAKSSEDMLMIRKQQWIHRQCHCYSHKMPFRSMKSELCYYVPPEHRKSPPQELLARIYCHDVALRASNDVVPNESTDTAEQQAQPCRRTYREVQLKSTRWPSDEDLVAASILYFAHRFANGTEFVGPNDPHRHHIFNFSDPQVRAAASQAGARPIISREAVVIQSVLRPHCGNIRDFNESHLVYAAECLDTDAVRRNMLKISVRLASPGATVYNESFTYDGMEFLSEVGGILGLWFGVSVLTFFELVELAYLIVRAWLGIRPISSSSNSAASSAGADSAPRTTNELDRVDAVEMDAMA